MSSDDSSQNLHKLAIDAALHSNWEDAVKYNSELLELEPDNISVINCLAKAHMELCQYKESKKLYEKVLELDQYNTIAQKNLKKIAKFKSDGAPKSNHHLPTLSAAFFVAEPGVTKSVGLVKVAEPQKLFALSAGEMVNLVTKSRGITVTDSENKYIGVLPDDLAFHMMKLLDGGNQYQAFIQSIKNNGVTILVREVFRSKKFRNQASFLEESKGNSYSSDRLAPRYEENDPEPQEEEVVI